MNIDDILKRKQELLEETIRIRAETGPMNGISLEEEKEKCTPENFKKLEVIRKAIDAYNLQLSNLENIASLRNETIRTSAPKESIKINKLMEAIEAQSKEIQKLENSTVLKGLSIKIELQKCESRLSSIPAIGESERNSIRERIEELSKNNRELENSERVKFKRT